MAGTPAAPQPVGGASGEGRPGVDAVGALHAPLVGGIHAGRLDRRRLQSGGEERQRRAFAAACAGVAGDGVLILVAGRRAADRHSQTAAGSAIHALL